MTTPPSEPRSAATDAIEASCASTPAGWIAERSLDATEALALLLARAPHHFGVTLRTVGAGWDNDVWAIEGASAPRLLRIPRRAVAADLPTYEAAVLPYLDEVVAAETGLAVPSAVELLPPAPGDAFPWPALLLDPVPGVEICRVDASDAERAAWAEPLGRFLRRLHAIDAEMATALGAPPDRLRRLDVARYRASAEQRLAQARVQGVADNGAAEEFVAALAADADACAGLQPRPLALCHGDLHLRHVLCDPTSLALTGIIDWGDVHIGDPAIDLAVGLLVLPAAAWPAFRAAYGDVAPEAWRLARLRAWFSALALTVYGHDVGDDALVDAAVAALRRLAATSPRAGADAEAPPRCAAVVFSAGFGHAGVHYVDADSRDDADGRVRLRRDGRVVWQSAASVVAEVHFFAHRKAALDFHRRRGRDLQLRSGSRGGSTAKTERAAYVERVQARLRGDVDEVGDDEGVRY